MRGRILSASLLMAAQAYGQTAPLPVLVSSGFQSNVVPLRCAPDAPHNDAGLARLGASLQSVPQALRIDAGDLFDSCVLPPDAPPGAWSQNPHRPRG